MANIPAEGFAASVFKSPDILGETINYDLTTGKMLSSIKPEKKESIKPKDLNSIATYENTASRLEVQAREIALKKLQAGEDKESVQLWYDKQLGTIGSFAQAGLDSQSELKADEERALKSSEGYTVSTSGSAYIKGYNELLDKLYKDAFVTDEGVFYKDNDGNVMPFDNNLIKSVTYRGQVKKQLNPYEWVQGLGIKLDTYENKNGVTVSNIDAKKVRDNIRSVLTKGVEGDALLASMAQAYFIDKGVKNPSEAAMLDLLSNNKEELINFSVDDLSKYYINKAGSSLRREGDGSDLNIAFGGSKYKNKMGIQPLGRVGKTYGSDEYYTGINIARQGTTSKDDRIEPGNIKLKGISVKPLSTTVEEMKADESGKYSKTGLRLPSKVKELMYDINTGDIYGRFDIETLDEENKRTGRIASKIVPIDDSQLGEIRSQLGVPEDVTITNFIDMFAEAPAKSKEDKTNEVPQASKGGVKSR